MAQAELIISPPHLLRFYFMILVSIAFRQKIAQPMPEILYLYIVIMENPRVSTPFGHSNLNVNINGGRGGNIAGIYNINIERML